MIRFAVFTDFHYDFIHDGDTRLKELIKRLKQEKIQFAVSLGDLCRPFEQNKKVVDQLRESGIEMYFAIGNHDIEMSEQREVTEFLGIENDYYSFVKEDVKFIILNACYEKRADNYRSHFRDKFDREKDVYPVIPKTQMEWLSKEMRDDGKRYVIFLHHSLANNFRERGVVNRKEVRKLLETRNVLLCMNGHDHGDECWKINGIPYFTLNSTSYIWHGMRAMYSYAPEVHERYPWLKYIIMYKDPLYAVVTIDEQKLQVIGMESCYQTITPCNVGIGNKWNGIKIGPRISDYKGEEK